MTEAIYRPDDPLLTAKQVAAELGIGVSTFWRDVHHRRWPAPYYVAPKAPRWLRSEIRAAAAARPRQSPNTGPGAQGMYAVSPQPE